VLERRHRLLQLLGLLPLLLLLPLRVEHERQRLQDLVDHK
jgi:hypothetical protein